MPWCESGIPSWYPVPSVLRYSWYPSNPRCPSTTGSPNIPTISLVSLVHPLLQYPRRCTLSALVPYDTLMIVFLHEFWLIVLLLLYHGRISPGCLNCTFILLLLRRFKELVWFSQVLKIRNLRNLEKMPHLTSEKLTLKMEEILLNMLS